MACLAGSITVSDLESMKGVLRSRISPRCQSCHCDPFSCRCANVVSKVRQTKVLSDILTQRHLWRRLYKFCRLSAGYACSA